MTTKLRAVETREEALRRLARLARKRGIRILTYPLSGEQFALSLSHPDVVHRLTRLGCDCLGFTYHNRCTHYAALLESLGELPPERPSSPASSGQATPPVVVCDQCDEIMAHMNGVTFECSCGAKYSLDWRSADEIDRALAELSQRDPDRFLAAVDMLTDEVLMQDDPAQPSYRFNAPATIGLFDVDPNDIAAVLIWRADLERASDEYAVA